MAESVVSDVLARLLEHLGKSVTEEFASYFGGKAKLKELQRTMKMIQARVYDAEMKGECEGGALVKEWLKWLKQILDRLEDLFSEVAESDRELEQIRGGNKFTKPLHVLFSMSSHFKTNKRVSCEARAIMQELKSVTSDMFSLNLREHPVEERRGSNLTNRRETHSFVLDRKVIGRDDEKRAIVGMIVNSDVSECVSVIPIIGIGGIGKTALAQLVFNDDNVRNCFELKCWVCISHISSLEEVVRKILKSLTTDDCEQLSMEQLQSRVRGFFSGKKYLLVLDDIWDENRERWLSLKDLLVGGKHGSRIIVTSRSRVVAENIGTVIPYELGGLSENKSWELFRNLAFKPGQVERNPDMISIGKEIVKKCANVPLAIRTIAAVLHSSDTVEEWEHFKDSELRHIEQKEDSIMWSLKLSFDHLPPHLKPCFAYCSLFPKGRTLYKQELTYLWMAQGLLGSLSGHGCLEDVGHVYFMELLRRSFFQEVLRDEQGEIVGCEMHDLMHELAQMVAGDEWLVVNGSTVINTENIRHVRLFADSSWKAPSWLLAAKQVRSFHLQMTHLTPNMILNVHEIFSSLRCLRSLDLEIVNSQGSPQITKSIPSSIGKLKQLRLVRLSVPSETLPQCITELQNLLTLDLRGCCNLRELPRRFSRMTSLRHLHLSNPVKLIDMPTRFAQLTSLQALDVFIVAENNGLDSLASLNNLAGSLKIFFLKHHGRVLSRRTDQILHRMKITDLVLRWFWSSWYQEAVSFSDNTEDDLVMQCTQPPPSLKRLQVFDWKGLVFPSWRMDLLPNLISVELYSCENSRFLPCLGQIPHLRYLKLSSLHSLESIETDGHGNVYEVFPSLSKLDIRRCSMLKSMPRAPILKSLILHELNGKLPQHIGCLTTLEELVLYKLPNLEPQLEWIRNFTQLHRLAIEDCSKLSAIPVIPYSLRQLDIRNCSSLKGISCALQHLLNLEEMEIECCEELDLWGTTDDDYDDVRSIISDSSKSSCSSSSSSNLTSAAWQGLKSLRCLKLNIIQKLETLPADLASLTTLQKLCIRLPHLRALPEWIGQLTQLHELFVGPGLTTLPKSLGKLASLKKLTIWNCPELQRRYHRLDDEFGSLVQHIPHLKIFGLVAQASLRNGIVGCATPLPLPPGPVSCNVAPM